ncbi:polyprenol monophosphomannose synthase [Cryomorpha ignava]|uniref:Polyprenol monophosphomannose synthase n=1 Tax=Cryomorpha ignava TaxID=101383 RepID=A0A7K3WTX6_9FLAO|nr:polyprenol monophosphomannose synthase [Cryomorpha ignava]NEN24936.1 polyprenol monophosphomannose synthase [Cryomorpha ignava]
MHQGIVIIPTYKEKGNIKQIIEAVLAQPVDLHILVVDDNSPDGTADIVRELQKTYSESLHLLNRKKKEGLGTAYIAGFKWCLEREYTYIFEMDADFSHNPTDLPRLLQACLDGADMSIGSRYVKGGEVSNWDYTRILISYFASLYVRSILWIGIKDATAGFVCYHRKVLEAINLDKIEFIGYAFQIEMKYNAILEGFKLVEVPITFIDRQVGQSKMSMKIFTEAFFGVVKMRF